MNRRDIRVSICSSGDVQPIGSMNASRARSIFQPFATIVDPKEDSPRLSQSRSDGISVARDESPWNESDQIESRRDETSPPNVSPFQGFIVAALSTKHFRAWLQKCRRFATPGDDIMSS
jgi:hypothetical protein